MKRIRFTVPEAGRAISSGIGAAVGGVVAAALVATAVMPLLYTLALVGLGALFGFVAGSFWRRTSQVEPSLEPIPEELPQNEERSVKPAPTKPPAPQEVQTVPVGVFLDRWRELLAEALHHDLIFDEAYHIVFDPLTDPSKRLLGIELQYAPELDVPVRIERRSEPNGEETKFAMVRDNVPETFAEIVREVCVTAAYQQAIASALSTGGVRAHGFLSLMGDQIMKSQTVRKCFNSAWRGLAQSALTGHSTPAVREQAQKLGASLSLSHLRYRDDRTREIYMRLVADYIRGRTDVLDTA